MSKGVWGGKGKAANALDKLDASQKIHVSSLPAGVTMDDMNSAFGAVGTVVGVDMHGATAAIIGYSSAEEAKSAIESFNGGDFNGSTLVVKQARAGGGKGGPFKGDGWKGGKADSWGGDGGKGGMKGKLMSMMAAMGKGDGWGGKGGKGGFKGKDGGKSGKWKNNPLKALPAEVKVWVGNLPQDITEEDMISAFSAAGTVKAAAPFGASKNFTGCVAFSSEEEAQAAISMLNGGDFNGNTIEVDVWTKKDPAESGDADGGKGKGKGKKGKAKGWW